MKSKLTLWLAAAPLLIAACQSGQTGNNAAAANKAGTANAVAAANTVAPAPAPQTGLELRLAGGGLTAGQPGLHPSATYNFGMTRAEIVAAVAAIRGPATGEDSNSECGAGPMQFTRFGTLTLNFQNGRWVGWDLSAAATPPLKTDWDATIGTSRANLDDGDRDTATVEQSTLGTEFEVSDISGLLSGPGATATVTHMWAGTDCAFR